MKPGRTLYDVLEVSQSASPVVVKAAYRSLAQALHPDKNSGTASSGQRLAEINDAYSSCLTRRNDGATTRLWGSMQPNQNDAGLCLRELPGSLLSAWETTCQDLSGFGRSTDGGDMAMPLAALNQPAAVGETASRGRDSA